jgi:hypothetical protein
MHSPSSDLPREDFVVQHKKRYHVLCAMVVAFSALGLYAGTVWFAFIWDDFMLILGDNAPTKGSFSAIWRSSFPLGEGIYYRPLTIATFWFDKTLAGFEPAFFHAVQIILYLICSLLVLWLACRLFTSRGSEVQGTALFPAVATALFFVVHPVHVEAVAFISARTDLLASAFSLLSIHAAFSAVTGRVSLR